MHTNLNKLKKNNNFECNGRECRTLLYKIIATHAIVEMFIAWCREIYLFIHYLFKYAEGVHNFPVEMILKWLVFELLLTNSEYAEFFSGKPCNEIVLDANIKLGRNINIVNIWAMQWIFPVLHAQCTNCWNWGFSIYGVF